MATENSRTTYRDHSILVTRQPEGNWVAEFARTDGAPMLVDGQKHGTRRTEAYMARIIAIADAELAIDAMTDVPPLASLYAGGF